MARPSKAERLRQEYEADKAAGIERLAIGFDKMVEDLQKIAADESIQASHRLAAMKFLNELQKEHWQEQPIEQPIDQPVRMVIGGV